MSAREIRNFINGEYVAANADSGFDVIDPSTEQVYATSPVSGKKDVDAAFTAAADAFEECVGGAGGLALGIAAAGYYQDFHGMDLLADFRSEISDLGSRI